jgi:hypothetical protein
MANIRVTAAIFRSALCILAAIPAASRAQEMIAEGAAPDDWQWGVSMYGWLPGMTGDTSFPVADGGGSSIEVDGSDIVDALNFAFLGMVEVHKGRWGLATDVNYLDLGGTKSRTRDFTVGRNDIPAGVTAKIDIGITGWIWTTAGTFRMVDQPGGKLDVVAGARMLDVTQEMAWHLDGDIGSLPVPGADGKSEVGDALWDGIVGLRGRVNFGADRKWFVPYYLDVGAGDSDMTLLAQAGVGYAFSWGDLVAAWRYIDYEMESGSPIESMTVSGPAIGATFHF